MGTFLEETGTCAKEAHREKGSIELIDTRKRERNTEKLEKGKEREINQHNYEEKGHTCERRQYVS